MRFLAQRILHSIFLLLGASVLCFWLVNLTPGDFFEELRLNPRVSAATIAALRQKQELSRPMIGRYWHWLMSVANGDWGTSLAYNSPAGPILRRRAWNTLLLTATATLLAWIVSIPVGLVAASYPGRLPDILTSATVSLLLTLPDVVLALLLLLFAVRSGLFPIGVGNSGRRQENGLVSHLFLPTVCLATGLVPVIASHVRAAVTESLTSPYVAAARAHGISAGRILLRYALPIAANPLISLLGLSIGMLISSSVLVENVFSWPGLGQLTIEAILRRDSVIVVDSVMLAVVFLIAGNLIADVLLFATDPRIRTE
jgi:peptide/nickel transport system permease protein